MQAALVRANVYSVLKKWLKTATETRPTDDALILGVLTALRALPVDYDAVLAVALRPLVAALGNRIDKATRVKSVGHSDPRVVEAADAVNAAWTAARTAASAAAEGSAARAVVAPSLPPPPAESALRGGRAPGTAPSSAAAAAPATKLLIVEGQGKLRERGGGGGPEPVSARACPVGAPLGCCFVCFPETRHHRMQLGSHNLAGCIVAVPCCYVF